jgi:hypothetical protein
MRVLVGELGSGLLASAFGMFVLGVHVRMRVKGPVAVTMFMFVLHVLVRVGVRESARMLITN